MTNLTGFSNNFWDKDNIFFVKGGGVCEWTLFIHKPFSLTNTTPLLVSLHDFEGLYIEKKLQLSRIVTLKQYLEGLLVCKGLTKHRST